MQHALDPDGGDRRALDRREQRAPQAVPDRRAETALERLGGEPPIALGHRLGSYDKRFGFWNPVHMVAPLSQLHRSLLPHISMLLAVQLDDQLFVDILIDVLAARLRDDAPDELARD